jgi:hypothetical protein
MSSIRAMTSPSGRAVTKVFSHMARAGLAQFNATDRHGAPPDGYLLVS